MIRKIIKNFLKKWKKIKQNESSKQTKEFNKLIVMNDKIIINLIISLRKKGLSAYVLPQNKNLPFSHIRKGILIKND